MRRWTGSTADPTEDGTEVVRVRFFRVNPIYVCKYIYIYIDWIAIRTLHPGGSNTERISEIGNFLGVEERGGGLDRLGVQLQTECGRWGYVEMETHIRMRCYSCIYLKTRLEQYFFSFEQRANL